MDQEVAEVEFDYSSNSLQRVKMNLKLTVWKFVKFDLEIDVFIKWL